MRLPAAVRLVPARELQEGQRGIMSLFLDGTQDHLPIILRRRDVVKVFTMFCPFITSRQLNIAAPTADLARCAFMRRWSVMNATTFMNTFLCTATCVQIFHLLLSRWCWDDIWLPVRHFVTLVHKVFAGLIIPVFVVRIEAAHHDFPSFLQDDPANHISYGQVIHTPNPTHGFHPFGAFRPAASACLAHSGQGLADR